MFQRILLVLSCLVLFVLGVDLKEGLAMKISSPVFENNTLMPEKFSCLGEGVNPELTIKDIPEGTASLALIVDDPDALFKTYVHWVLYDIPLITRIEENSTPGTQGVNTSGGVDYVTPCPPSGTHRYFFKVYALDKMVGLDGLSKQDLENEMQGHILDKAELVGLYKKR
ncbi:MAG: YbhB/YbcL family Raf kinase inhibitor-like protein [Candidatus Omnitrophota bacterium]